MVDALRFPDPSMASFVLAGTDFRAMLLDGGGAVARPARLTHRIAASLMATWAVGFVGENPYPRLDPGGQVLLGGERAPLLRDRAIFLLAGGAPHKLCPPFLARELDEEHDLLLGRVEALARAVIALRDTIATVSGFATIRGSVEASVAMLPFARLGRQMLPSLLQAVLADCLREEPPRPPGSRRGRAQHADVFGDTMWSVANVMAPLGPFTVGHLANLEGEDRRAALISVVGAEAARPGRFPPGPRAGPGAPGPADRVVGVGSTADPGPPAEAEDVDVESRVARLEAGSTGLYDVVAYHRMILFAQIGRMDQRLRGVEARIAQVETGGLAPGAPQPSP